MFENRVEKGKDEAVAKINTVVEEAAPKAYEKPILVAYGDVRDVTLGPTNGEGESGNAVFFRVPPP